MFLKYILSIDKCQSPCYTNRAVENINLIYIIYSNGKSKHRKVKTVNE